MCAIPATRLGHRPHRADPPRTVALHLRLHGIADNTGTRMNSNTIIKPSGIGSLLGF